MGFRFRTSARRLDFDATTYGRPCEDHEVIVRISRARLRPNCEAAAFGLLRDAIGGTPSTKGLIAFVISRRMIEGRLELMAMTTWADMEAMTAILGPDWDRTAWLPGLDALIESSDTALYETIAESFAGFGAVDATAIDLLAPGPGEG